MTTTTAPTETFRVERYAASRGGFVADDLTPRGLDADDARRTAIAWSAQSLLRSHRIRIVNEQTGVVVATFGEGQEVPA